MNNSFRDSVGSWRNNILGAAGDFGSSPVLSSMAAEAMGDSARDTASQLARNSDWLDDYMGSMSTVAGQNMSSVAAAGQFGTDALKSDRIFRAQKEAAEAANTARNASGFMNVLAGVAKVAIPLL